MEPQVLRGVEKVCPDTIVMGDPDRVELFSRLLEEPETVYSMRGIRVVNGKYKGKCITLASHGIGCPMASVVLEELRMLGAETMIRIGTAGSLVEELREGMVLLASSASTNIWGCISKMYYEDITPPAAPDPFLLVKTYNGLKRAGLETHVGAVFTSDAFYAEANIMEKLRRLGFKAIDMETAALYTLGVLRGYRALSVLVISNNLLEKTPLKHTRDLADILLAVYRVILEVLTTDDQ